MRRLITIAVTTSLIAAGSAAAETWKAYSTISPKSIQWSYDADYSYRDKRSGRVVVLTAAGKVGAEPRIGPSGPGAADGAGAVLALDCRRNNFIFLSGFSPGKPPEIPDNWRRDDTHAVTSDPENKALIDAVCPSAGELPER